MSDDPDKIRTEIERFGMAWVRSIESKPTLDSDDITRTRVMHHFGFRDTRTAMRWLLENGFKEDHVAIDPDNNNRPVTVWAKRGEGP